MIIEIKEKERITNPKKAFNIMSSILNIEHEADQDKEHFWVIGLTANSTVKYVELVSLGTLTSSLVHPREVFRTAITQGIASIICSHNHPGGSLSPSKDDINITKRLKEAGEIIGIKVINHIIISKTDYFSMSEKGCF